MRLFVITILMFLLSFAGFAQDDHGVVAISIDSIPTNLRSNWLYKAGDDASWAKSEVDDSDWETVTISLGANKGNRVDFNGIAWFRLHLMVDSTVLGKQLALSIKQAGASEIYLDGNQLISFGEIGNNDDSSLYYNPQGRPVTFAVNTVGKHTLAIRYAKYNARETVESFEDAYVGLIIELDDAESAISEYRSVALLLSVILLTLGSLFFSLAFVHFLLWLYHKEDKANLYYSIFGICLGTTFFTSYLLYTASNPQLSIWGSYINVICITITFLAMSGLSNELFSKRKIRFYILAAISALAIVLFSIFPDAMSGIIAVVVVSIVIESMVLTIIAIYKKRKGAKIVGVGVLYLTLFLLTVFIIGAFGQGISLDNSTSGIITSIFAIAAILAIPISMSIYLGWNFAAVNKRLNNQLQQVQVLSEKTIAQEQEKKRLLETQNERLEHEVEERTREIVAEKHKSDELLRNILPEEIAEELKQTGTSAARHFDHVSVLFTDFVNFTKAGERMTAQQLVNELDTCFKAFDAIMTKYHIEKIKTIGDAYLAVCGLPIAIEQHAENTVHAALEIMDFMRKRKQQFPATTFDIRIGIHSGPVVAGIVGVKKFAYDIWGDTVNTAARMESSSEPDKINISTATFELVKSKFECAYRGEIAAKNKGEMDMYFVESTK